MVARCAVIDVAVLFGNGFEFAIYEVPADKEFQELLLEAEIRLWQAVEQHDPARAREHQTSAAAGRGPSGTGRHGHGHQLPGGGGPGGNGQAVLADLQEQCEAHLKMAIGDNEALLSGREDHRHLEEQARHAALRTPGAWKKSIPNCTSSY